MPAIKKRKLSGPFSLPGTSAPRMKSSKQTPPASKPIRKPAPPPPEPEQSEDEDEEFDGFDEREAETDDNEVGEVSDDTNESGGGAAPSANTGDGSKKTFADLGVRDELCEACENLKFTHPTPIQEQAIPLALQERDVIGLAETGSGKTAAFVLPILQALMENPQPLFGLVLSPTRELAYQIAQQVEALGSIINVKCATLVGGMDMVPRKSLSQY